MGLLQLLQYQQAQPQLHPCLPVFKGVTLQALRLWKLHSSSMVLFSTTASVSGTASLFLLLCTVCTSATTTPCFLAGAGSRQPKHQSKAALQQVLSDGRSAQPSLPCLQAATQNLNNTSMLGRQMQPCAAEHMSSYARHGTASAAHSIHRPRKSHLAALKAHGDLDSVLQSAARKQDWPAQRQLRALTKSVANAGQTAPRPKSKPVRDMFGVAADNDSATGADLGLVLSGQLAVSGDFAALQNHQPARCSNQGLGRGAALYTGYC